MNEFLLRITIDLPIENYMSYIISFFNIAIIIIAVYSIELVICLYFLFKKEDIKQWYAFVPFLNVYYYFKITKTPFWTIFVPLVNLVVLAAVPYKLAKQYECKRWIVNLSIPFSIFVIPYISFSNLLNKDIKNSFKHLKSVLEIDAIDASNNEQQVENLIFEEYYTPAEQIDVDYLSNVDNMINEIEENALKDDYFLEDDVSSINVETTITATDLEKVDNIDSADLVDISEEDMLEIFDKVQDSFGADDIEELEKKMENPNAVTIIDNAEYKEVEEETLSNEHIAFGGENQKVNLAAAKNNDHVCSRCGSSLVGAVGSCPGCGAQIN